MDALLSPALALSTNQDRLTPRMARLIKGSLWSLFAGAATAIGMGIANQTSAGTSISGNYESHNTLTRPFWAIASVAVVTLGLAIPTMIVVNRAERASKASAEPPTRMTPARACSSRRLASSPASATFTRLPGPRCPTAAPTAINPCSRSPRGRWWVASIKAGRSSRSRSAAARIRRACSVRSGAVASMNASHSSGLLGPAESDRLPAFTRTLRASSRWRQVSRSARSNAAGSPPCRCQGAWRRHPGRPLPGHGQN